MRKIKFLLLILIILPAAPVWAATMESIGKDEVNVRAKPSTQSDVLFQACLGYPIHLEKQQGEWALIQDWQDNTGWVYKPLLSRINTAIVLVDNANIRKGPGLSNPVVRRASRGEIYKVFGERGHWVKIGYYLENKVIGWMREDLVWGE